jgi:hypothetical protein
VLVVFVAPLLILTLVLAVPIAYRYLWPVRIKRPRLFLGITVPMGLLIAVVAVGWFASVLVATATAGASGAEAAASHKAFESVLWNRFLVAALFSVVLQYLLCRITQTIMDI